MNKIGYVSIEDANNYISSHYLSTDTKRDSWDKMSEEDKTVLLTQSLDIIENLSFIGRKTDKEQELSFPRNGSKVIPEKIKSAQIVGALSILDSDGTYEAIESGITSERVGNVSYTYSKTNEIKKCRPEMYKFLKGYIKNIQILNIR